MQKNKLRPYHFRRSYQRLYIFTFLRKIALFVLQTIPTEHMMQRVIFQLQPYNQDPQLY